MSGMVPRCSFRLHIMAQEMGLNHHRDETDHSVRLLSQRNQHYLHQVRIMILVCYNEN